MAVSEQRAFATPPDRRLRVSAAGHARYASNSPLQRVAQTDDG
jgi:hypothetical protein